MINEIIQFNLEEAVNSVYSNNALRKHFYDKKAKSKKSKGNLGTNQTKQLLDNMNVDWYKVEISGGGANRIITCMSRKEVATERQDNRKNNGKGQIPYEEVVRNLTLLYLNQDKDKPATITVSALAHKLGLMSDTLHIASKKITAKQQMAHYDNLVSKYKVGYSFFWHIVSKESKRIKDHLNSILTRMSRDGIIYYRDVTNAVVIEDKKKEPNPIDNVKAFQIKKMQANLREKHDITIVDIIYRSNHRNVLAYKEDEERYFNSLGIEYVYDAKIIGVIATDKEIENYMKDNLIIDFKLSHVENAKRLANNIQDQFYNKLLKAQDNSKLIEELGGRKKPEHSIFKGTEYELVMKDSQRLSYDAIAQAKVSRTYPIEYSEKLKAIQGVLEEE
ncbi:hypothetical protein [Jeotgalibacillus proteolyticus]|uniref:Uncharacterized protein n=1 Tax=Jeotgalibacillus proteolyticus TaxID=2082395 RepID=A0A2S5G7C1_9BACL|nr:hypothetical protein [Jeotgalibacillus proteolyticus]PPA68879.1 hypothetical protein C4B60_18355 [Jeotgalibacillus proteolyticus]